MRLSCDDLDSDTLFRRSTRDLTVKELLVLGLAHLVLLGQVDPEL
jgi:hypothetical protein